MVLGKNGCMPVSERDLPWKINGAALPVLFLYRGTVSFDTSGMEEGIVGGFNG